MSKFATPLDDQRKNTLCRYGYKCRFKDKGCGFRHKPIPGEIIEYKCQYSKNCCNMACPLKHPPGVGWCTLDVACPDPIACGNRHSKMSKMCNKQVWKLPDDISRKDICVYAGGCRDKECQKIHLSPRELVEKGWIVENNPGLCSGWSSLGYSTPCQYWHACDSYYWAKQLGM